MKSSKKLSVRLSESQMLVLGELSTSLDTSISVLLRSIVLDFLQRNEDRLYHIIDERKKITMEDIHTDANNPEA